MIMRLRRLMVGVSTAGLLAWAAMAIAGQDSISPYVSEVDDGVVLAGTLDLEALRASHDGTVRIVDLRTEPEGAPEEAAAAAALSLEYTNIPVAGASIVPEQVAALRAALDGVAPGELLVVHCGTGNRAGMLWGATETGRYPARVSGELARGQTPARRSKKRDRDCVRRAAGGCGTCCRRPACCRPRHVHRGSGRHA